MRAARSRWRTLTLGSAGGSAFAPCTRGRANAMTGLTEAAKSRTPLVVLAADTAASAIRSNFRIEQDNLVRAVGAVPERLHGPASAVADAARAWRRAEVERRPVVLMLPLDVQAAPAPTEGHASA